MSLVKINEDQYLGKQELNRFKKSLSDDGYRRALKTILKTYGVVFDSVLFNNSLEVYEGTAGAGSIGVRAGILVNKDIDFGINSVDNPIALTIPNDGVEYYIFARYRHTIDEVGTISISTNGTITGTGTLFKEVLRGQPSNPVKIKFTNSASNLGEYEVLEVTSDTVAIITGTTFVTESNLKYSVVGSFTPGVVITATQKNIYQYDSIQFAFTSSLGTLIADIDIPLAKVKYTAGVFTFVEDLRLANSTTIVITQQTINNNLIALLNKIQTFTQQQTFARGTDTEIDGAAKMDIVKDGNTYRSIINNTELKFIKDSGVDGTEIAVVFSTGTQSSFNILTDVSPPSGYLSIITLVTSVSVGDGVYCVFRRINLTGLPLWILISTSDTTKKIQNLDADIAAAEADIAQNASDINDINAVWTLHPFSAPEYALSGGSGTVSSGAIKYKKNGKTLHVIYNIAINVTGAGMTSVDAPLPTGLSVKTGNPQTIQPNHLSNAGAFTGISSFQSGSSWFKLQKLDGVSDFSIGTAIFIGMFTIEIN